MNVCDVFAADFVLAQVTHARKNQTKLCFFSISIVTFASRKLLTFGKIKLNFAFSLA